MLALRSSCFILRIYFAIPFEGRLALTLVLLGVAFIDLLLVMINPTQKRTAFAPAGWRVYSDSVNKIWVFWKVACFCLQAMIQLPHTDRQLPTSDLCALYYGLR